MDHIIIMPRVPAQSTLVGAEKGRNEAVGMIYYIHSGPTTNTFQLAH